MCVYPEGPEGVVEIEDEEFGQRKAISECLGGVDRIFELGDRLLRLFDHGGEEGEGCEEDWEEGNGVTEECNR